MKAKEISIKLIELTLLVGLIACSGGSEVTPFNTPVKPDASPDNKPTQVVEGEIKNTYKQENSKKIDILWVVDDSRSMLENQQDLARNFQSFVNQFLNQAELPDFQTAVVTTDPEDKTQGDGRFFKGKTLSKKDVLKSETQFIKSFQELVKVGIDGSGTETSLRAILRAIHRQKSFFRQDAPLIVNIISDEKDSSINYGNNGMQVKDYVNAIKKLKTGQRVMINSIVHLQDTPRRGRFEESRGTQQLEAASLTNGISADIRDDFGHTLSAIGDITSQLVNSFPLTDLPKEESIKVYVNGVIVSNWEYDADINAVVFKTAPKIGSQIEIIYKARES